MANRTLVESNDDDAFCWYEDNYQLDSLLRLSIPKAKALLPCQEFYMAVHTVSKDPPQLVSFKGGLKLFSERYPMLSKLMQVRYLDNDILVRCNQKQPVDAINWLLSASIHRLLGHFHQGKT